MKLDEIQVKLTFKCAAGEKGFFTFVTLVWLFHIFVQQ